MYAKVFIHSHFLYPASCIYDVLLAYIYMQEKQEYVLQNKMQKDDSL